MIFFNLGCFLLQNRTCSKIVPTYLALLKSFSLSLSSRSILRVCLEISDLRTEMAGCIVMMQCVLPRSCFQGNCIWPQGRYNAIGFRFSLFLAFGLPLFSCSSKANLRVNKIFAIWCMAMALIEDWIHVPRSGSDPPSLIFLLSLEPSPFLATVWCKSGLLVRRLSSSFDAISTVFYKNNPHVSYIYIGADCSFLIIYLENIRKVESRNIRMILETLFNISGWKFLLLCLFLLVLTWLLYKVVEEQLSPLQRIPCPPGDLPVIGHLVTLYRSAWRIS